MTVWVLALLALEFYENGIVMALLSRRGREIGADGGNRIRGISQVPTRSLLRVMCSLDPGGTTTPRIPALLMLRSTITTVSAPPIRSFLGSITHPTPPP